MEESLRDILEINEPERRYDIVRDWKKKGGKVVGIISDYVPEEILTAFGILPFRITGTWRENIQHARIYRPENTCGFCNHVLESYLTGELDILDGIVAADIDQDVVRLIDVMVYVPRVKFIHLLHVPFTNHSKLHHHFFARELKKLSSKLSELCGREITDDDLLHAMKLHDEMRALMSTIYETRKMEHPPLSGSEVLRLVSAASVMPKGEFTRKIRGLLSYISGRKANLKSVTPRLMVIGDMLDNPRYLEIVEAEGCAVVMDDLDLGSRYVYLPKGDETEDPFLLLARRYLRRHGSARMATWKDQADQIVSWVKEFKVDGVLGLPLTWCYPQQYRIPYLSSVLEREGIPNIFVDREYHLANVGQLKTRVGAFIESLRDGR